MECERACDDLVLSSGVRPSAYATTPAHGEPHEIKLPDGYHTWAAAWIRGATVLLVLQKGSVRSDDFANPAEVKETSLEERESREKVPKPILNALRAALDVAGAPVQQQESQKPAAAAPK